MEIIRAISSLSVNQLNIIAVINKNGPISRKKIASILQLTPASITQQTSVMISEGILYELGENPQEEKKAGRKEILLAVSYDSRKLLGIDIERNEVHVGLTDLQGMIIGSQSFEFDSLSTDIDDFNVLVHYIKEHVNKLYDNYNIIKAEVLYCGVGIIGSQFVSKRNKKKPLAIIGKYLELEEALSSALQLPVKVENNVRALALAEGEFNERDQISNFIFVKIGPKIGSAIVMNNSLIRGESDSAGELGYFRVDEYYPEISKALNFEDIISLEFYLQEFKDHFNKAEVPVLFHLASEDINNIKMSMIFESLRNEDTYTLQVFTKKMKILALFLHNIQILLDLKKVYIFLTFDNDIQSFEILKEEASNINIEFAQTLILSESAQVKLSSGGAAVAAKELFQDEMF